MTVRAVFLTIILSLAYFTSCTSVFAQTELVSDTRTTMKAEVLEVISQEKRNVPATQIEAYYQTLRVLVLDGPERGKELMIENDFLNLKKGEKFYLIHSTNTLDGSDEYYVSEPYRLPSIFFFAGLFFLCVFLFGGLQGIRGLIALAGSLLLIMYVLLPGVLQGYSPVLVATIVAGVIVTLGSYVTHGFNRTTTAAVAGMVVTIVITGLLAYLAVTFTKLTGFSNEEAVYLNLDTRGQIDFAGLLLGGILIGLLGVLYDMAIGQAVAVEELREAGKSLSRKEIFKKAQRLGREHVGALVNTLAIAYVGISLPLLLLFYSSPEPILLLINQEIFATEIIRILIGSIGLVLAVPITTLVASYMLVPSQKRK